jgi:hypothetical protein
LFEYGASTIGYGALGETNVVGCHPFTSTKEILAIVMEIDNEVTSLWCSQVAKEAFHTKHVKLHQSL